MENTFKNIRTRVYESSRGMQERNRDMQENNGYVRESMGIREGV